MSNLKILDLSNEAAGKHVWVVGDIHGEFEMFHALLNKISYQPGTHVIIAAGDMVDRGDNSPAVVEWFQENGYAVLGNHEQMWLQTIEGVGYPYHGQDLNDKWILRNFGGGLGTNGIDLTLNQFMDHKIPAESWFGYFESLPHGIIVGDWLILHGGVNTAKSFEQQSEDDILWARDEFMFFGITPPESRMGKRLVVGHNETFWLGSVGKPVYRKDAVFVDIGTANQLALGAFCLNSGEFAMVEHRDYDINAKRIADLFANTVFLEEKGDEYEQIIASSTQEDPRR